ncbi:MAG: hypothetical protein K6C10_10680 [Prevotella sp.]|nr:hypothetical protein [Prevotella sp.]
MKRIFQILAAALLSATSLELHAQHNWAIALIGKNNEKPTIMEYHSVLEKAENGIEYHRIFDDNYRIRGEAYNPIRLQYGYRWVGKQMFVYDFEKKEETLAFDFNLSIGDHFTTFNGMEWEVEIVKDTLVNISFCGKGDCVTKKLITVKTPDGTQRDQWLEDFGSFTNLFMISSMEDVEFSQTLWMEYGMGEYLTREISTGTFFTHDSGWLDNSFCAAVMPYTVCTYNNGNVLIENVQMCYEHRDYSCFYREGDDIYQVYSWELEPHVDNGKIALRKDNIILKGLPAPESGKYTIHHDNNLHTTNISMNGQTGTSSPQSDRIYDLQGRRLQSQPAKGIYIKNGKKMFAK